MDPVTRNMLVHKRSQEAIVEHQRRRSLADMEDFIGTEEERLEEMEARFNAFVDPESGFREAPFVARAKLKIGCEHHLLSRTTSWTLEKVVPCTSEKAICNTECDHFRK